MLNKWWFSIVMLHVVSKKKGRWWIFQPGLVFPECISYTFLPSGSWYNLYLPGLVAIYRFTDWHNHKEDVYEHYIHIILSIYYLYIILYYIILYYIILYYIILYYIILYYIISYYIISYYIILYHIILYYMYIALYIYIYCIIYLLVFGYTHRWYVQMIFFALHPTLPSLEDDLGIFCVTLRL